MEISDAAAGDLEAARTSGPVRPVFQKVGVVSCRLQPSGISQSACMETDIGRMADIQEQTKYPTNAGAAC